MRGELLAPALRVRHSDDGELNWRQICDVLGSLPAIIVVFSGVGLLLSIGPALLDPSVGEVFAAFARAN